MFKTMYGFWLNRLSNNTLGYKLNIWYISNVRSFNILSTSTLNFMIYSLNSPKVKYIKTIRSNVNFDYIIYFLISLVLVALLISYIFAI